MKQIAMLHRSGNSLNQDRDSFKVPAKGSSDASVVIVADSTGRIAQFSRPLPDWFHGVRSLAPGNHLESLFPLDSRPKLQAAIDQVLTANQVTSMMLGSETGSTSFSVTIMPLYAGTGTTSGVCLMITGNRQPDSPSRDVASDPQAHQHDHPPAGSSIFHFRSFFESAPGLYLVLEPTDFRIVAASEAYLQSTMRLRNEVVGKKLFEAFPDNPSDPKADGVRNLRRSLERVKATGRADIMPIQRYPIARPVEQGGGWEERFWSPINSPVVATEGRLEFIIHRVEDVTAYISANEKDATGSKLPAARSEHIAAEVYLRVHDLQRLNDRLRESEQRFRLIFENARDFAIFTFDSDGLINSWNPGAERVFGYSSAEAIGSNVEMFFTPEDRIANLPLRERQEANSIGCAVDDRWHLKKDGTRIFLSGAVRPLLDRDGRIYGFAKLARDITRLKSTEDSLHESTALVLNLQDRERRRIGRELHDSTAQDLAALEMTLSLIEKRAHQLDPRGLALLNECIHIAHRCSTEIRTISYLLHPPLLDELGLVSALEWYIKGFSQRSGIDSRIEVDPNLPRLSGDIELALFRIVQECLSNIHRHSGSPAATIQLQKLPGEVSLEISDFGIGHPHLQNLGDHPMVGVGIAGMRERVRQLKGTIEVSSNSGGTVVRVVLPVN
jgi:PAS domain S-box-containing protein